MDGGKRVMISARHSALRIRRHNVYIYIFIRISHVCIYLIACCNMFGYINKIINISALHTAIKPGHHFSQWSVMGHWMTRKWKTCLCSERLWENTHTNAASKTIENCTVFIIGSTCLGVLCHFFGSSDLSFQILWDKVRDKEHILQRGSPWQTLTALWLLKMIQANQPLARACSASANNGSCQHLKQTWTTFLVPQTPWSNDIQRIIEPSIAI